MTRQQAQLEQLIWQFRRRVSEIDVGDPRRGELEVPDDLKRLHAGLPAGDARDAVEAECVRFLAMHEIFVIAASVPETANEWATSASEVVQLSRSDEASAARRTLSLRYELRIRAGGAPFEAPPDAALGAMAMYLALVEEFESSPLGRRFIRWLAGADIPSDVLNTFDPRAVSRRFEANPNDDAIELLEGAAVFVRLIKNIDRQLTTMDGTPNLARACWQYHAHLFGDRAMVSGVAVCIHALRLAAVERRGESSEEVEDDAERDRRAQLALQWSARLEDISRSWERLTTTELWYAPDVESSKAPPVSSGMFSKVRKTFQWGSHSVTMETGEIARQSTGAVLVNIEDTVVLATVVAKTEPKPGQDFFPLTVDYIEKAYAVGKIPGSFFKREGRPSELETLTSRLIDRPIRPLFPEGFFNEVQVVVHVLSLNPEVQADIAAMIATSAALSVSGVPFNGPIGAARVGYVNGEYVLNPGKNQLLDSKMDLVVACADAAVLMVESESDQLSEDIMLGAVVYGHEQGKVAIDAIHELVREAGKPVWDWKAPARDEPFIAMVTELAEPALRVAYQIRSTQARSQACRDAYTAVKAGLTEAGVEFDGNEVDGLLFEIEARIVRGQILAGEPRIDGRDTRTVRPIEIRAGVLPHAHGSSLFTCGETQALVVATLGTERDAQVIDALPGEYSERFMLHYNMPPFATGETGRVSSPTRSELGHGRLAKRALVAVLPSKDEFPYSVRVVSEITESNGSSSMASVCGGCLSLMDAGVPLKAHVAGISMGLIKDGNRFAVLTDILGDENHLGDMDFKVAGSTTGITALQMDIKVEGITKEIMQIALAQAKEARMHILGKMMEAVADASTEMSQFAPRLYRMKINPERIRDVIGKGGTTIRALTDETGTEIEISEDGTITIASTDADKVELARTKIEQIMADVEIGKVYEGPVTKILDFGALVNFLPGKDGLLHISQIAHQRVEKVTDFLQEGQIVTVKVLEIDMRGRIKLSMTAVTPRGAEADKTIFQGDLSAPA